MEGFLPLVYKSLKKNKIRRRYECLSTGAAESYNVADFYHPEDAYNHRPLEFAKSPATRGAHHRRYNSVHVVDHHVKNSASESEFGDLDRACDHKPKQLVRFRSHRMFSCINGT
ncbi:uncharacterized protein [Henckelia pumila]|uniref:uncharacterized protein n=1 Tax=Henckelia pumila TaxID=405737 RepID=UPI003C6EA2A2